MPAAPSVAQLALTTTTGNVMFPGDCVAEPGGVAEDLCLASAGFLRPRSATTKVTAAIAIAASAATATGTMIRRRDFASALACRGPVTASATMVASASPGCGAAAPTLCASARAK